MAVLGVSLLMAAGCSGTCDSDALRETLEGAQDGDTVQAEACRYEGSFHVPAGVTLRGRGAETVIVAPEGQVGVELEGSLASLAIESHGRAGIAVREGSDATISDVDVSTDRGIGIGVEGSASLARVSITGPVSAADADDSSWIRVLSGPVAASDCADCECTPGDVDGDRACDLDGRWSRLAATHGIVARGATLTMESVDVRGLARFGVVLEDSETTWMGGSVRETLGVGVEVIGGSASLDGVSIEQTLSGLRGEPSYAVIAAGGAMLSSADLALRDNDRYGLVQLGSSGTHERLIAERQGDAAVWVQDSSLFTLSGEGTRIADGSFAGVVVIGSSHVHLSDAVVDGVSSSRRPVGLIGAIEVGDGVQVTGSYEDVRLERVSLSGHARAGLVVEIGTAMPSFTSVEVDAAGTALGAVAGTPESGTDELVVSAPAGWDTGIVRSGAAAVNDAAFSGRLSAVLGARPPASDEVLGVVAPMF